MTSRPQLRYRRDLGPVHPMGGGDPDPGPEAAARLGVPFLRFVDGAPVVIRPTEEN